MKRKKIIPEKVLDTVLNSNPGIYSKLQDQLENTPADLPSDCILATEQLERIDTIMNFSRRGYPMPPEIRKILSLGFSHEGIADTCISWNMFNIHHVFAWCESGKQVIRFNLSLEKELHSEKMSDIPTEGLNLPYNSMYVQTGCLYGTDTAGKLALLDGYFVTHQFDETDKRYLLSFLPVGKNSQTYRPIVIDLQKEKTMDDVVSEYADYMNSNFNRSGVLDKEFQKNIEDRRNLIRGLLQTLLYICSDENDVQYIGGSGYHSAVKGVKKPITEWKVGYRIGPAIQKARKQEKNEQSENRTYAPHKKHAPMRPHIRRAHFHHFWTKDEAGNRKLIVKWLAPITVNFSENGSVPVTFHDVKK